MVVTRPNAIFLCHLAIELLFSYFKKICLCFLFFSFFLFFFLVKYFLKETLAPHLHSWPNNKWESKMCYIFHFKAFSQVHKLVTETLKPQCMRWFHLHKHWHSKEGKDSPGTPGFFFFLKIFQRSDFFSIFHWTLRMSVCVCV